MSFIKQYANDVLDFINCNIEHNDLFVKESKNMNCFLEQYYLYFLCKENDLCINTIHPDFFSEPKKNKKMFFNIPTEYNSFNHFLGNSKKLEIVNDFVKRKLLEYYPSYYTNIKNIFKDKIQFEFFSFNKSNKNLDMIKIRDCFIDKLSKSNLQLSNKLYLNFIDYWSCKYNLLQVDKNKNQRILDYEQVNHALNCSGDFLVKLSDNFIDIRKYELPWEMLYLTDRFENTDVISGEFNEISDKNLINPPIYCVFSYTPFESSISSFWITKLHAYILSRVLNKEFQPLSEIIIKVQALLLKNQENSYNKIKSLLLIFFNEISNYEIIDIQNIVNNAIGNESISYSSNKRKYN